MKVFGLTVLVGSLVTPFAASAAPVSTSTTVPLVQQALPSAPARPFPIGPSVANLLTPQQFDNAWQDYIAAHFNVGRSP